MEQIILSPDVRRGTILDLLRSAQRRMLLSLFRCDDSRVLDEIVATVRRNIDVKVLVTPRARGWNDRLVGLVTLLKDAGADVRQYSGPCSKYHAKYMVADDERVMIGSLNLTRKCFENTCDFMLVGNNPDLAAGLTTLFESDWQQPETPLPQLSDRLLIGPNHARARLLKFLEGAKYRIRIIDHRVSHPEVLLMIARKMRDGVRVQILGRGEVAGLTSHGKLIIIDDSLAIFGSASLSRSGLDDRRELSVSINDAAAVPELTAFFDAKAAARYPPGI